MRKSKAIATFLVAASTAAFAAACGSSSPSSSSGASSADWSKVSPLTSSGDTTMAALVKAAKEEGQLNVITLPTNWANYGNIMKDFTAKYGIKITDAIPEGSSGQEITAVQTEKGQSRAPDVVDVGTAFAVEGATDHLWAPYEVQSWNDIPADAKDGNGDWYADYGGYVAIGYDPAKVKVAADIVREPDQPRIQEHGRPEQQPDDGRRRVRGRLRGVAGERRLVQQHHAGHPVLREAEEGRQLRPDRDRRRRPRCRTAPRRS